MIVFAGPSLGAPNQQPGIEQGLNRIDVRPPAACGDIIRAVAERPRAIGLIDGLFETTAAPWHKEILWALAHGIPVFGAASMGAIRAVELAAFGMQGIGKVFRHYRDGFLEDDDEIAVQHGPAEMAYVALSDALVNIRASLTAACEAGILDTDEAEALSRAAKAVFYKDRTWERILADGIKIGLSSHSIDRFAAWIPENRVDIKRQDAWELMSTIGGLPVAGPGNVPSPTFPNTLYFEELRCQVLRSTPN